MSNRRVWYRSGKVWPVRRSRSVQLWPSVEPCRVQSFGSRPEESLADVSAYPVIRFGALNSYATQAVGVRTSHFVLASPSVSFSLVSLGGFSPLAVTRATGSATGMAPAGRVPISPVNQVESTWARAASAMPTNPPPALM